MKARLACLAAGLLATLVVQPAHATLVVPGCGSVSAPGGDWPSYGGGQSNARSQAAEDVINASTAANIGKAWVFRTGSAEYVDAGTGTVKTVLNGGSFDNTPVIANGCLFLATSTGWVMALNADKDPGGLEIEHSAGKQRVRWATKLDGAPQALRADVITGSPVVANGVVYVGVNVPGKAEVKDAQGNVTSPATGPYVAALDESTGAILWQRVIDAGQPDSGTAASPLYFNGMIFEGWFGTEAGLPNPANAGGPEPLLPARGGYAIVDASPTCDPTLFALPNVCKNAAAGATGGTIKAHEYTITDAEYAAGYRGASVWCSAAFDPQTNSIYACGGNPANKKKESRYANSILKIDGNPGPAFGKIVGHFKGESDQYYPGLDRQPACDELGDRIVVLWSVPCLQLDLDFGASPHLFKVRIGGGTTFEDRTVVGDLQKSGVYHAVWADDMSPAWSAVVGTPCFFCNSSSPAVDAAGPDGLVNQVYVYGTNPGQLVALSGDAGRYRWALPVGDPNHFQSVTVANGVVYAIDNEGTLTMVDAANGLPIARRLLSLDAGGSVASTASQGVAVARHSLYVATADAIIVLR
jgi:hypothetical protein